MEIKNENMKENKMGTMSINRLLISMSAPIILSMLVQAMYNVVDSIFVSQINEDALTAVSLAFPLQQFMVAVAVGTFVGVNALLSRSLGEKNQADVNKTAINGLFLSLLSYILFLIIGIFFSRLYISLQTDSERILEYGVQYLSTVCIFSFGWFAQNSFEKMLISTGKSFYTMITQMLGAVINVILDPLLIFGIGIFPEMGVRGAAVATVIGQISAALLALYFNHVKNNEVELRLKGFRPDRRVIRRIYDIGVPSIVMISISSILIFGMNKILMAFSSTAVAVFGIYFKVQSFVFMPVFGINNGMIPIISYNYGKKERSRMIKTIKQSIIYAIIIMLTGFAVMQLFADKILALFSASQQMMEIGVPALRIISICFIFAGITVVLSSVFQSVGMAYLSMITSIARQLIIILPIAVLLAKTGNVDNVWWAFPIAEFAALILTVFFLRHTKRKVFDKI
ncbi:putative efflux protein, MATE family [Parasporobacterium paucivorans DSM 15970]|uniref:Probable multidrug resistance protein NorM n=2 Tax=Parasporobacterium TaxID=115543 RepID=A0A1M6FSV6_9FIRM|nr:putative efflux protein, MATE family [Parasporobacterium paucivorans DSM 15970]